MECAANGAYFSTGQRCTASSRLIVTEGIHDRFVAALTERLAAPEHGGQLALTFEIVYGHAYKPQPKVRLEANSAVSLEDMKAMLKQPRNTGLR